MIEADPEQEPLSGQLGTVSFVSATDHQGLKDLVLSQFISEERARLSFLFALFNHEDESAYPIVTSEAITGYMDNFAETAYGIWEGYDFLGGGQA